MGNGQSDIFHRRFSEEVLVPRTRGKAWGHYVAQTSPELSNIAQSTFAFQEREGMTSISTPKELYCFPPPPSPQLKESIAKSYINSPPGTKVIILKLNKKHSVVTGAKAIPQQRQDKNYKHRYLPFQVSKCALEFVMTNPHFALIPIVDVQAFGDSELYAVCNSAELDLVGRNIHKMCPSEILYGLTCIVRGLKHLHKNGYVYRNLSWSTVCINTSTNQKYWALSDFQFMINQNEANRADSNALNGFGSWLVDYLSEIRGLREVRSLIYLPPEENKPNDNLPPSKHAVGSSDMFSFGVMLEQLIGKRNLQPVGTNFDEITSPFGRADCSTKEVIESLRKFAMECQNYNPNQRPSPDDFLSLPCIINSTFVKIMMFFDNINNPEKSEDEKVLFFNFLHLELLKLPYELVSSRLLPIFLLDTLWYDKCALPFLRHLIRPLNFKHHVVKNLLQSSVLKVPLQPDIQVRLQRALEKENVRKVFEEKQGKSKFRNRVRRKNGCQPVENDTLNDGEEEPDTEKGDSPQEKGTPRNKTDFIDKYVMMELGIFKEGNEFYHVAKKIGNISSSSSVLEAPYLMCAILRAVPQFYRSLPTNVLYSSIITFLKLSLHHSCSDVVYEGLQICLYMCESFKRAEKKADEGPALLEQIYNEEVFYLATAEYISEKIRLSALSMAFESLTRDTQYMRRDLVISAFAESLMDPMISWHVCQPDISKALGINSNFPIRENSEETNIEMLSLEILKRRMVASKSLTYISYLKAAITPKEISETILPALVVLLMHLNAVCNYILKISIQEVCKGVVGGNVKSVVSQLYTLYKNSVSDVENNTESSNFIETIMGVLPQLVKSGIDENKEQSERSFEAEQRIHYDVPLCNETHRDISDSSGVICADQSIHSLRDDSHVGNISEEEKIDLCFGSDDRMDEDQTYSAHKFDKKEQLINPSVGGEKEESDMSKSDEGMEERHPIRRVLVEARKLIRTARSKKPVVPNRSLDHDKSSKKNLKDTIISDSLIDVQLSFQRAALNIYLPADLEIISEDVMRYILEENHEQSSSNSLISLNKEAISLYEYFVQTLCTAPERDPFEEKENITKKSTLEKEIKEQLEILKNTEQNLNGLTVKESGEDERVNESDDVKLTKKRVEVARQQLSRVTAFLETGDPRRWSEVPQGCHPVPFGPVLATPPVTPLTNDVFSSKVFEARKKAFARPEAPIGSSWGTIDTFSEIKTPVYQPVDSRSVISKNEEDCHPVVRQNFLAEEKFFFSFHDYDNEWNSFPLFPESALIAVSEFSGYIDEQRREFRTICPQQIHPLGEKLPSRCGLFISSEHDSCLTTGAHEDKKKITRPDALKRALKKTLARNDKALGRDPNARLCEVSPCKEDTTPQEDMNENILEDNCHKWAVAKNKQRPTDETTISNGVDLTEVAREVEGSTPVISTTVLRIPQPRQRRVLPDKANVLDSSNSVFSNSASKEDNSFVWYPPTENPPSPINGATMSQNSMYNSSAIDILIGSSVHVAHKPIRRCIQSAGAAQKSLETGNERGSVNRDNADGTCLEKQHLYISSPLKTFSSEVEDFEL